MANDQLRTVKAQLNSAEVIEALRTNKDSEHWGICIMYLQIFIRNRFPYLPVSLTVEDAAQEAALLVYRNVSTFRGDPQFTTWAASIAFRSTVDMLRKLKTKNTWEVQANDYGGETRDELNMIQSGEDPEALAINQEKIQELRAQVEEFLTKRRKAERDREILHKTAQYYTYQEIAQELRIHHTVVSSVVYAFRDFWSKKYPKK